MIAVLKQAFEAVETLPEAEQKELAEGLMAYFALAQRVQSALTSEQIEGVKLAMAQARAGDFASDAEVDETWRKFGL